MRSIRTRLNWIALAAASLAAVLIVLPLGCREPLSAPLPSSGSDEASPRRGGTLHLASFQDIRNLDPTGPADGLSLQAVHLLFAGLVDYDEQGKLSPELADHWNVEDDGRTYRFVLRPGVTMHDGEELTADDVRRSIERALDPATPNPNASYFENIDGFAEFQEQKANHLRGVTAQGRNVVVIRLRRADATFLPMLAMHSLRPVCKTAGDHYSDTWMPCGAGPFKLAAGSWRRGTSLRLVRHDGYFRAGLPFLDAVEWDFNVHVAAQRFRFEEGTLDILRDMSQADQARFAADPRWASLASTEADRSVFGESMNTRMAPFDRIEIRRAVAAAIDRDHYKAIRPGSMTVLTQLVPPGVNGFDPAFPGQRHDHAAALDHMRRAGYPYDPQSGKGGWPDPIVYPLYDQGLVVYTAQLLQQDLAKIGLRIDLRLVSWPAFLALQQREGGAAISQANWEMDYPDPSSLFDPLFSTKSINPESTYNTSFYSNPRLDDLLERARIEADPGRRMALYRQANAIVCDEAPWAFAFAYHSFDLRQSYVRGFRPHPVWPMDVSRVWIDRPDRAWPGALGALLR